MLTVLSVAYGLAGVSMDAVGGAEQVLYRLDHALAAAGHRSIVIAAEGSRIQGRLLALSRPAGPLGPESLGAIQQEQRQLLTRALDRWPVDLVHMHGVDFADYLPDPGVPVLATLHLPLSWYSTQALEPIRPGTHLNCVSASQRQAGPPHIRHLRVIRNGVPITELPRPDVRRREYVLGLGRVCPEKGFHLALDAARLAGVPLILGGRVFDYPEHRAYFDSEIRPRLDAHRRFMDSPSYAVKRRLLSGARALLVPSTAAETSSLVAMEALACGTPVIAFRRGALPELVRHGHTGYLVDDVAAMAEAVSAAATLDRRACLDFARTHCSCARMTAEYLSLYHVLRDGGYANAA
jgi:glycosyltransferase involved in cell wall biosynthesis